ncbi:MAG TPA: hypothetical protein VK458_27720 [Myxococcaceae bacterium]|nr:hypothetical protein [Myxococcaceae bacterium]
MSEQREWKLGAHQARFEAPNTLWMKFQGPISYEAYVWAVNILRELGGQQALIVVADMTENTTMDTEGQRYASEHIEPEWCEAVIYMGARLIHKAGAKGFELVYRLLGKKVPPVHFASTEAQARDTIARLRANPPA